jgi:hypothetical protein
LLSARAVGSIEEAATNKPQTIIVGIASIDILEIDFHCIESSFEYNSLWSLTRLSLVPAPGYFNAESLIC